MRRVKPPAPKPTPTASGAAPPQACADFEDCLNPRSLEVLTESRVEPSLATAAAGACFQFERQGYFCRDTQAGRPERLVFNRTVGLRDSWAKIEKAQQRGA